MFEWNWFVLVIFIYFISKKVYISTEIKGTILKGKFFVHCYDIALELQVYFINVSNKYQRNGFFCMALLKTFNKSTYVIRGGPSEYVTCIRLFILEQMGVVFKLVLISLYHMFIAKYSVVITVNKQWFFIWGCYVVNKRIYCILYIY